MTVCVAAMCEGGTVIIGASDRMITSHDLEFEPSNTKAFQLGPRSFAMCAGASHVHAEIAQRFNDHTEIIDSTRELAEWYAQAYNDLYQRSFELSVLGKYGLKMEDLLNPQSALGHEVSSAIQNELNYHTYSEIDVIVCGIDIGTIGHRASMYRIEANSKSPALYCMDGLAFCAIGSGAAQAHSHLMLSRHMRFRTFAETLFTVYAAKRKAEVSAGVGIDTDMYMAYKDTSAGLAKATSILPETIERLRDIYDKAEKKHQAVDTEGFQEVGALFDGLVTRAAPQNPQQTTGKQPPKPPSPESP